MASMSAAAARLGLRSASLRGARLGSKAKVNTINVPSSAPTRAPPRIRLRSPVETTSFCVESLLPVHGATASALMISMLSLSRPSSSAPWGWLSEGS